MREMRRSEYQAENRSSTEEVLDHVRFGQLALIDSEGWPAVRPMNFARSGGAVYFHGAQEGEKTEMLDGPASFTAVDLLSSIPSSWRHPEMACPATTYYRSVLVRGRLQIVADLEEKAAGLEAFMRKYQPEGGYRTISAADPRYRGPLESLLVYKLDLTHASCKIKVGQNLQSEARQRVFERLLDRGEPLDLVTARRMAEADPTLAGGAGLFPRQEDGLFFTDRAEDVPLEELRELMNTNYWAAGRTVDQVRRLLRDSALILGVLDGGKLVAVARCLSDGTARAWIYDVIVTPERRGNGLGQRLMKNLLAHPRLTRVEKVNLSTRDAMTLYKRFGFEEIGGFSSAFGKATMMLLQRVSQPS